MKETEPASCNGQTQTGLERNCDMRGRCLPTSILFTPRGRVMAYEFRLNFERICMMCVIVVWSRT